MTRGAVMHAPGDVRVEERDAPQIIDPTGAVLRDPDARSRAITSRAG